MRNCIDIGYAVRKHKIQLYVNHLCWFTNLNSTEILHSSIFHREQAAKYADFDNLTSKDFCCTITFFFIFKACIKPAYLNQLCLSYLRHTSSAGYRIRYIALRLGAGYNTKSISLCCCLELPWRCSNYNAPLTATPQLGCRFKVITLLVEND